MPRLLELAIQGSRMPGFHHDVASKLQSLVMALDEISELSTSADPELRVAVDTAGNALRELQLLFTANRSLAKPPQPIRVALRELMTRASERAGVQLRGELPSCDVRVAVPALVHALGLVLDVAAGPSHLGRVVQIATTLGAERVEVTIAGPPGAANKPSPHAGEALAIATFALSRDAAELRCTAGDRFAIVFPLGRATTEMPKP
jgi:hypothetical protein